MLQVFNSSSKKTTSLTNKLSLIQHNSVRSYKYQTELYTKKFTTKDEQLLNDLRKVYTNRFQQPNLYRFVNAYQQYGFKQAKLDPLELDLSSSSSHRRLLDELDPSAYDLNDREALFPTEGILFTDKAKMNLNEIESYLKSKYSTNMAIEFDFIQDEEEKLWLAKEYENLFSSQIDSTSKVGMLKILLKSQVKFFFFFEKSRLN
jgi:2-oxoglutarate dehydrogenase complex dehydrogenase (E1) component-like enzyme